MIEERRKHFDSNAISSSHDEQPLYVYVCYVHVHDALCRLKNAFCSVQTVKVFT
jgi:hypothetical protein